MANTEFAEFLKLKKERETLRNHVDWDHRKAIWLGKIDELLQSVQNWLAPYKSPEEGEPLLDYITGEIEIYEEQIGSYRVPAMTIQFGSEDVRLTPKGLVILGGFGRIDMIGPLGSVMIVLNDSDKPPTPQFQIPSPGKTFPPPLPVPKKTSIEEQMSRSSWYFVPPNQRRVMLLVTEESFLEMLRSMVRP
ncbi:MAG: hypothetical protein HQL78_06750 [Magnetococcales bacterium]|nr:hypothetical protein [Magnetococcales bacterium]MBF0419850.1 hypothetical protein [Magnetococcales bacterium]